MVRLIPLMFLFCIITGCSAAPASTYSVSLSFTNNQCEIKVTRDGKLEFVILGSSELKSQNICVNCEPGTVGNGLLLACVEPVADLLDRSFVWITLRGEQAIPSLSEIAGHTFHAHPRARGRNTLDLYLITPSLARCGQALTAEAGTFSIAAFEKGRITAQGVLSAKASTQNGLTRFANRSKPECR